jgi:hypothetical protein
VSIRRRIAAHLQAAAHRLAGRHLYLSTGCLHGRHDYCQAMTGHAGAKRPAECKFCGARCVCACHQSGGERP